MDNKENKDRLPAQEAEDLKVDGKERYRRDTKKTNRLWLWLGVLILCFILIWWLWGIGTAEDVEGTTNNAELTVPADTEQVETAAPADAPATQVPADQTK